jgi:hypothetical protein
LPRTIARTFQQQCLGEPMSGLTVKLDVNKLLELIGSWVGRVIGDVRERAKVRTSIPALTTKMAHLAGLKLSLAASLAKPELDDGDLPRLAEQLQLIEGDLKDIVNVVKSADPQFGAANPQLLTLLSMTIDLKYGFVQQNSARINLSNES